MTVDLPAAHPMRSTSAGLHTTLTPLSAPPQSRRRALLSHQHLPRTKLPRSKQRIFFRKSLCAAKNTTFQPAQHITIKHAIAIAAVADFDKQTAQQLLDADNLASIHKIKAR